MIIFGYIARMARAGMVEALASDYTRTAVLKGLTYRQVIWRHVLRNALLPTITVVATQSGYLIGGLVVVETLFHYHGIGGLIFAAGEGEGFPDARRRHPGHRSNLHRREPSRRHAVFRAQSAHFLRTTRMSTALTPDVEAAPVPPNAPSLDTPDVIRRQRLGCCCARRLSLLAQSSYSSGSSARSPDRSSRLTARTTPTCSTPSHHPPAIIGSAPTNSAATCSRASSSARATS